MLQTEHIVLSPSQLLQFNGWQDEHAFDNLPYPGAHF